MSLSKTALICCLGCLPHLAMSQQATLQEKLEGKDRIEDIMKVVNAHYAEIDAGIRDRTDEINYKHWARWAWYMSSRTDAHGRLVDVDAHIRKAYESYRPENRSSNGNWQSIGPASISGTYGSAIGIGRVDCIAFHPTDPDILYIGSPSGGLFRSTDGGNSWTPLTDNMPSTAVSGIVVSHADPNTIYILTGDGDAAYEGYLIFDAGYFRPSAGVFVSHDAGTTWLPTGKLPLNKYAGHDLVQDPENPDVLLAATSKGLCRTENGGLTWTKVLSYVTYEVKFAPYSSDIVYATQTGSFYRSLDNGVTWTEIIDFDYQLDYARVALAVSSDTPHKVYLLSGFGEGYYYFGGFYTSSDWGASFTRLINDPNLVESNCNGTGGNNQSAYDLALAVSHTSSQKMLAAGVNIWRSASGGDTWLNATAGTCDTLTQSTGYVHGDIHDIEYSPLNGHVYVCTDGGIVKSENDGIDWINLSDGIVASQIYHMGGSLANTENIMIGLQDNGVKRRDTNTSEWDQVRGGDGFDCLYNFNGSSTGYVTVNAEVFKFTNNGSNTVKITPTGLNSQFSFFPRVTSAVNDGTIVLAGYYDILRSTDAGDTWTNVGAAGNWDIEQCPSNNNWFYAAGGESTFATTGNLWFSNDVGQSWTQISGNSGYPSDDIKLTDIAVRPNNASLVWIAFGGFSDGVKVFHSANSGNTWTNMSGTLPNVPINAIEVDGNNNVYIGTDIGVFYRGDEMSDWVPFWHQLPIIPVSDLELYEAEGIIRASTFGRGVWQSDAYSTCPETWIIGADINGNHYYEASAYILSSGKVYGGKNTRVLYKAGSHISLLPGFKVEAQSSFRGYLAPCGVANDD